MRCVNVKKKIKKNPKREASIFIDVILVPTLIILKIFTFHYYIDFHLWYSFISIKTTFGILLDTIRQSCRYNTMARLWHLIYLESFGIHEIERI